MIIGEYILFNVNGQSFTENKELIWENSWELTNRENSSHEKQDTPSSSASFFWELETFVKLTIADQCRYTLATIQTIKFEVYKEPVYDLLFKCVEQFGRHDIICRKNYNNDISGFKVQTII